MQHVLVVGGGLAGLAAATALGERGLRVTLLESRQRLGGRASSFFDPASGEWIDNCQHVSLGCCTNFADFCRRVGIDHLFRRERVLYFLDPHGRLSVLSAASLPAPLHLAPAFLRSRLLSMQQKWRVARGLVELCTRLRLSAPGARRNARCHARQETSTERAGSFADWLHAHGQDGAAIDRFWALILTSALSEELANIDTAHARKVFADAFLAHPRGWEMLVPAVPLAELYGEHLREELHWRGVEIQLNAAARRLHVDGGRVKVIELRDGRTLSADWYVLAVPPERALDLLPDELINDEPYFGQLRELPSSPITSVHVWFDRPITTLPHAILVGRTSQWLFNRTALQAGPQRYRNSPLSPGGLSPTFGPTASRRGREENNPLPPGGGWGGQRRASPSTSPLACQAAKGSDEGARLAAHYYQVVISASRSLLAMGKDSVLDVVRRELNELFPAARQAELVHARVVTEHAAVLSVRPGVEERRPPQQSHLKNLLLAGDWTRTGWPPTMEGAVRSGYLAAEALLTRLGRPATIVKPELPVTGLARWLLRKDRCER